MRRFKAFTLAEVLITLGIIGVVAVVTMPTLIQNHRKQVVETRLEKFYSSINQAVQLAENEFGEREYWDWHSADNTLTDYEWFNKYLAKYIKTIKIEETSVKKPVVYFPDGSAVLFSSGGINFFPNANDYKKYYEKYYGNSENYKQYSGQKYFAFFYYPNSDKETNNFRYEKVGKSVEPYKYQWDGTVDGEYGLKTSTSFGCNNNNPTFGGAYCTAIIQQNGWKIPKDYPFRF